MTSEPLRSSLRPLECFNGGQVPQIEHEYSVNQSFPTFEWIGLTGKLTNWSPQAPPALSCRPWWPYGYYHDTKKKHSWQQILPENRLCWGRAQVLPETSSISSTRAQEGCWGWGGASPPALGRLEPRGLTEHQALEVEDFSIILTCWNPSWQLLVFPFYSRGRSAYANFMPFPHLALCPEFRSWHGSTRLCSPAWGHTGNGLTLAFSRKTPEMTPHFVWEGFIKQVPP